MSAYDAATHGYVLSWIPHLHKLKLFIILQHLCHPGKSIQTFSMISKSHHWPLGLLKRCCGITATCYAGGPLSDNDLNISGPLYPSVCMKLVYFDLQYHTIILQKILRNTIQAKMISRLQDLYSSRCPLVNFLT